MERRSILLLTLVLFSFFLIPRSYENPDRRVFMWWQTGIEPIFSAAEIGNWAKNIGVTDMGIYWSLSAGDRAYLQSTLGLHLFQIYITPTTTNLMNWTDYVLGGVNEAASFNSDGIIFDDTQLVWYQAQENGTVDDLSWYQAFLNNVSAYAVPEFGSDNVIVDMAAWGDSPDYEEMPSANAADFIFSYYYPPDPEVKYQGYYTNMSLNAWDIKGYHDTYGLNTYYKYQGWLWMEGDYSSVYMTTYSIMETYNAITTFADSYNVDDLFIYNVYQLYYNHKTRIAPFLKEIITAWKADETLSTSKILLQNFPELYWQEGFTQGISNQSTLSTENWQIISQDQNYSYTTTGNYLTLQYVGINPTASRKWSIERLIGTNELGLSITAKITPVNISSDKYFIITGVTPHPNAYQVKFGRGTPHNISFTFRDQFDDDNATAITQWTSNSQYSLEFTINETYVHTVMHNSTWTWNMTIPESQLKYNSIKLYSIILQDNLWGYGSSGLDFISFKVDDIILAPLCNSFSFDSYELGEEIKGKFGESITVYMYYGGYPEPINITGVSSYSKFGATDPNLNDTLIFEATANTIFRIYWTEYAFWLPFEFMMGLFGLVGMIGFPMLMINKCKKKEFSDMGWMFAGACISAALFFAWLWMA